MRRVVAAPPLWLSALERDLTGRGLRVVATAADGPSTVNRAWSWNEGGRRL